MRKNTVTRPVMALLWFVAAVLFGAGVATPAHADYFQYPCNYPFVGSGADVQILLHGGGQYCDGPTEINWSHYHCASGGGGIGGGAIGLTPIGGVSIGGFGGSGIGLNMEGCRFVCPDGSTAPFPNPPAAWIKHLVLDPKNDDCVGHMGVQGDTSTPLRNQLPDTMMPGEDPAAGVAVPTEPGALPSGQINPVPVAGPPVPAVVGGGEEQVPMPSGKPVTPDAADGSPLTPGSPMQLP
jgi:hypothetical protein